MPDSIERVVDTADEILAIAIRTLEQYGLEVPENTYLALGGESDVAHDHCSQLTVSLATSRHGLPNPDTPSMMRSFTCHKGYVADYVIQIVRCSPGLNDRTKNPRSGSIKPRVSKDDIDATARLRMMDVMVMHRIAEAINARPDSLGASQNYTLTVGPDMGQAQAVSLVIPVNF